SSVFYIVYTDSYALSTDVFKKYRFEIDTSSTDPANGIYVLYITAEEAALVEGWSNVKKVVEIVQQGDEVRGDTYPHHKDFPWNFDNFGPITVPAKGWTVAL